MANTLIKQKFNELGGNYILQFTNENNITERYYTSINPCNLISTNMSQFTEYSTEQRLEVSKKYQKVLKNIL